MDNKQALGYMLLACKELGLSKNKTKKLYGAMYHQFNHRTEDEAEESGHDWYFNLEEEDSTEFKWASPSKQIKFPQETKMSELDKALLKKIREYKMGM